jgi:hypothetical protein
MRKQSVAGFGGAAHKSRSLTCFHTSWSAWGRISGRKRPADNCCRNSDANLIFTHHVLPPFSANNQFPDLRCLDGRPNVFTRGRTTGRGLVISTRKGMVLTVTTPNRSTMVFPERGPLLFHKTQ